MISRSEAPPIGIRTLVMKTVWDVARQFRIHELWTKRMDDDQNSSNVAVAVLLYVLVRISALELC